MAKPRHNIDYFFRRHLPDYEASNSTGNWDLLNHLLNEQERKRKNRKWVIVILSLALLLSGSLIVYHLSQEGSRSTIKSGITHQQDSSYNSSEKKNKETAEALNSVKKIEETLLSSTEGNQLMGSGLNAIDNKVNSDREMAIQNKNKNKRRNGAFGSGQVAGIEVSSNAIIQPDPINTSSIVDSSQSEILISNPESFIVETQNISDAKSQILIKENDSLSKINTAEEILNTNRVFFDSTSVPSRPKDSSHGIQADTQMAKPVNAQPIIPADSDNKKFNISTGVNIYTTSEAFTNNKNIAPLLGFEYTFHLDPRWSVGLGAWYSPQGGYKLKDTATQETYFFDYVVNQQAIHIRLLHKLYFPLSIYYKLSNAHLIGIGLQPSYLLNTTGNYVEIQHTTTSNSKSQENNVSGYMDGIKPVNFAMHVAYKYKLSKRLDFGVRLSRELTGAYEREYFYGINTKPSWGLQALIHFNF